MGCRRCLQRGLCGCVDLPGEAHACRRCRRDQPCGEPDCPRVRPFPLRFGKNGRLCLTCRAPAEQEWTVTASGVRTLACSQACAEAQGAHGALLSAMIHSSKR